MEHKPLVLEAIFQYFKHYFELKRSSLLQSTILLKFCEMLYFNPKFTILTLEKLGMFDQILYGIYGNIELYQDVDEKESFILGSVGLFSLDEKDYP